MCSMLVTLTCLAVLVDAAQGGAATVNYWGRRISVMLISGLCVSFVLYALPTLWFTVIQTKLVSENPWGDSAAEPRRGIDEGFENEARARLDDFPTSCPRMEVRKGCTVL